MDSTQKGLWSPTPILERPPPLPLGESAPFLADFCQNISFSPRLCCLFYRSLSLCCEGLRLLVMEVNLTNLWISPFSILALYFFPPFSHLYVSVRIFPCYSQTLSIHFSCCASFSLNRCETRGYWLITAEFLQPSKCCNHFVWGYNT